MGTAVPRVTQVCSEVHPYHLADCTFFVVVVNPRPRICLLILEREEGNRRERNIDVRETSISCHRNAPQLGIKPET